MSDNLSWKEELETKFQLQNLEESSPLHYIFEQRAAGSFLLLKIPHKLLLKWREIKNVIVEASYIDLLHLSTTHLPFSIKPGTERVEECLRTVATKVYGQGKGLRGTTRTNFYKKEKSIQVHHHELEHGNSVIKNRLAKCEEEKEDLKGEIQELERRCEELLQELQTAEFRVHDLENEPEKTVEENKQLSEYIDFLEEVMVCTNCSGNLRNHGRPIHEVCKRQGNRKIKEVKTRAAMALWFLESFGLTLDSVKVKDKDGKVTELDYGTYNGTSFQNLSQEGQDTVRSLLYIMDKFCVGDAAYHEVSMIVDDAPRSYLIKQCRSDLNKIFHISKTPGKHAGAQMSFKEELRVQIKKKVYIVLINNPLQLIPKKGP